MRVRLRAGAVQGPGRCPRKRTARPASSFLRRAALQSDHTERLASKGAQTPAPGDPVEGRESRRKSEVAKRSAVPAVALIRRGSGHSGWPIRVSGRRQYFGSASEVESRRKSARPAYEASVRIAEIRSETKSAHRQIARLSST